MLMRQQRYSALARCCYARVPLLLSLPPFSRVACRYHALPCHTWFFHADAIRSTRHADSMLSLFRCLLPLTPAPLADAALFIIDLLIVGCLPCCATPILHIACCYCFSH